MKFATRKDSRKRDLYNKYELAYITNKVVRTERRNDKFDNSMKWVTKHRIKNRCTLTSRSKGVLGFFKLSRMCFKDKASFGYLAGIRKASW